MRKKLAGTRIERPDCALRRVILVPCQTAESRAGSKPSEISRQQGIDEPSTSISSKRRSRTPAKRDTAERRTTCRTCKRRCQSAKRPFRREEPGWKTDIEEVCIVVQCRKADVEEASVSIVLREPDRTHSGDPWPRSGRPRGLAPRSGVRPPKNESSISVWGQFGGLPRGDCGRSERREDGSSATMEPEYGSSRAKGTQDKYSQGRSRTADRRRDVPSGISEHDPCWGRS